MSKINVYLPLDFQDEMGRRENQEVAALVVSQDSVVIRETEVLTAPLELLDYGARRAPRALRDCEDLTARPVLRELQENP